MNGLKIMQAKRIELSIIKEVEIAISRLQDLRSALIDREISHAVGKKRAVNLMAMLERWDKRLVKIEDYLKDNGIGIENNSFSPELGEIIDFFG